MGNYTKNLYKRGRTPAGTHSAPKVEEWLISAAIKRDGVVHSGKHNHAELRVALGDEEAYQSQAGDIEGFMTNTGRFLTREQAKPVGEAAGQCSHQVRPLLSSDITWKNR
jgi:hypothetical protein